MTDQYQGWGAPSSVTPPSAPTSPAGWYPDPWARGHHRYWDGSTWTGGSFPNGPASPWSDEGTDATEVLTAPPSPPPAGPDPSPPPPPEWSPPTSYLTWTPPAPTDGWAPAPLPATETPRRSGLPTGGAFVALVVAIMVVVGTLATLGGYLAFRHKSPSSPAASGLPPASVPTDRSGAALDSLVLQQTDVASTVLVQPDPNSGQFSAADATLDLCNGTFASEAKRTARVQVTAISGTAISLLSTEAALYQNPAATEQAFAELKSVAANCPSSPVTSPIGEPTVVTQFNATPDTAWAANPTVTRLAYDFTIVDETGATQHSVAVYLRRGRVLMGIYFFQPDAPQITVAGQNTIEKIAAVFAGRMANLPSSVVNG